MAKAYDLLRTVAVEYAEDEWRGGVTPIKRRRYIRDVLDPYHFKLAFELRRDIHIDGISLPDYRGSIRSEIRGLLHIMDTAMNEPGLADGYKEFFSGKSWMIRYGSVHEDGCISTRVRTLNMPALELAAYTRALEGINRSAQAFAKGDRPDQADLEAARAVARLAGGGWEFRMSCPKCRGHFRPPLHLMRRACGPELSLINRRIQCPAADCVGSCCILFSTGQATPFRPLKE